MLIHSNQRKNLQPLFLQLNGTTIEQAHDFWVFLSTIPSHGVTILIVSPPTLPKISTCSRDCLGFYPIIFWFCFPSFTSWHLLITAMWFGTHVPSMMLSISRGCRTMLLGVSLEDSETFLPPKLENNLVWAPYNPNILSILPVCLQIHQGAQAPIPLSWLSCSVPLTTGIIPETQLITSIYHWRNLVLASVPSATHVLQFGDRC